jgi:chromosome segregation ATPase
MIYKAIKRRNGDIYLCPAQLESAGEYPLTPEQLLIIELDDKVTELEQDLKDSELRRKDLLASLQSANQQKAELEQLLKDAEERASMFEMAGVLQFKEKEKLEQEVEELKKENVRLSNLIRYSRE